MPEHESALPDDYFEHPSPARVWNYWLGGKDNYPIDQQIGDAVVAVNPQIKDIARQVRRLLARVVRPLAADAGVRQFLDIGTGLPTEQNTHEVAQAAAPDSKIVYVDNDPLVLAHARALLTNTTAAGVTTYVHADVREPELLLAQAAETLDFGQPIAVLMLGILGHAAPDYAIARGLVGQLLEPLVGGSYLVLQEGLDVDETFVAGVRRQTELGHPFQLRTRDEFAGFFDGLDVLEPGLVPAAQWRPELLDRDVEAPAGAYVGVGRKR